MNSISKKLATILLCAYAVFAQTSAIWDGTVDNRWHNFSQTEFTINTAEEFAYLAQAVNNGNNFLGVTINLGANIMLNDTTNWRKWNEKLEENDEQNDEKYGDGTKNESEIFEPANTWTAIGASQTRTFRGIFRGNGFVVSGVYINSTDDYQGLFGYANGEIENLGVVASFVRGREYVGGLIGRNDDNGKISTCYAVANVEGRGRVGGLVGMNYGFSYTSRGEITDSYAEANVIGGDYVGGLVGENRGDIANSYATGDIFNNSYSYTFLLTIGGGFGGLAGENSANISNCRATGNVSVANRSSLLVGGLVGYNRGVITDCHATGNVISADNSIGFIGGLVGLNGADNRSGQITNSFATGNVTGGNASGSGAGGLVGASLGEASVIENCYATGGMIKGRNAGGLVGLVASGSIKKSYATGNIEHDGNTNLQQGSGGGLVGTAAGASIENSYAIGNVMYKQGGESEGFGGGLVGVSYVSTITNCYSIGVVMSNIRGGGLVGENTAIFGETATNSYWDIEASSRIISAAGEGKTTEQMKRQATFVDWNFSEIWGINAEINDGYPFLRWNVETGDVSNAIRDYQKVRGALFRNNPVSEKMEIMPEFAVTEVIIYDALGNVVHNSAFRIPNSAFVWDLRNSAGRFVANGAYLVVVEAVCKDGKKVRYSGKLGVRR